jgi:hypothetical protein
MDAMEHQNISLGACLDIEGAFDKSSFTSIKTAAIDHGIEPMIHEWIGTRVNSPGRYGQWLHY